MTIAITIRLPDDLAKRYDHLAKETGRTASYYMAAALLNSIDQFEYEYGILKQVEDFRAGRLETYSLDEVREMLKPDA